MAIGLMMKFKGLGTEKYDQIMDRLGLERAQPGWPEGVISHVAGGTADGSWCVFDVWKSRAAFDAFFASRLGPVFESVGGVGQPEVTQFTVHYSHGHG